MRQSLFLAGLACLAQLPVAASAPVVELDHLWIVVQPGAPERVALQKAGFTVWPAVQRHEGQGTASVMVELDHCFIELLWRDSTVRVDPGKEALADRFARRAAWRTSGWSPIGIGTRRTTARDTLPFSTWSVAAGWKQGGVMQLVTARTDSTSPSVWVVARSSAADNDAAPAQARQHPNGAQRITALGLTVPAATPESNALTMLRDQRIASVLRGDEWVVVIVLDSSRMGRSHDLRPALPIFVRY